MIGEDELVRLQSGDFSCPWVGEYPPLGARHGGEWDYLFACDFVTLTAVFMRHFHVFGSCF